MAKSALDKAREAPGSTKARILAAAEAVFAAKGFQGASTREIAARAGVNISSLHYHWESKETLYFTVFRNIYDQIVDLLRNTLAPLLARQDARESAIDATMRQLFDFFADNPNVPKLLMRRIVENEEIELGIERDILAPAWGVFSTWVGRLGSRTLTDDNRGCSCSRCTPCCSSSCSTAAPTRACSAAACGAGRCASRCGAT